MAAGKGTRMKSALPKVLHPLAGKPLLGHVLATAHAVQARNAVVITGHGAIEVESPAATGPYPVEQLPSSAHAHAPARYVRAAE